MKFRKYLFATLMCAISTQLFTASANIGDIAVYNNEGDSSLAPIAESATQSYPIVNRFANTVIAPINEYTLETNGDGVKLTSGGKHLVIYNTRIDQVAGSNRAEMQSYLTLNRGTTSLPSAYGRSQGFFRNLSGADEAVLSGGTIVDALANDILRLNTVRSDRNSGQTAVVEPGHTAIQLVKLDDSLDCLRIRQSINSSDVAVNPDVWEKLTWNTIDSTSSGAFSFIANSGDITINQSGYYMIFANTHVTRSDARVFSSTASSSVRCGATQRLTINGDPVEGSITTSYFRGTANGEEVDDGIMTIGIIIKADASDILNVEHMKEGLATAPAYRIIGEETALAIAKLPSVAKTVLLKDTTSQDFNTAIYSDIDLNEQIEAPASTFSHSTITEPSKITINADSHYLFMGAYFDDDDGPTDRQVPNPRFAVNGTGLSYGETSQYSRDDNVHNNGNWFGMISNLESNDYVQMTSHLLGAGGTLHGESVGLQGVDIASMTTAPVIINCGPIAAKINTTVIVTPKALLTRDSDTAVSSIIYTLTSPPSNATVYKGLATLGVGDTFTQADINNNLITIEAGSVISTYEIFNFIVSDGVSPASTATFSLLTSAGIQTVADTGTTDEDTILTNLTGMATSLLANDVGNGLFVSEHDSISALNAAVTVNSDGSFTYDPNGSIILQKMNNGVATNDTFSYTVVDTAGLIQPETVTITINGTNDSFAAVNDYINETELTETNALTISNALLGNDGITTMINGSTNEILMLNYTAEHIGTPGYWDNTGYNTQIQMSWIMDDGCMPVSVNSSYPGITRAYRFNGYNLAKAIYNNGGRSIHDIVTGDPDLKSATFEMWLRPDALALAQTNCLFETGGTTGIGLMLERHLLKAACNTTHGQVQYDLFADPMGVLDDDITNEFFQIIYTVDMENDLNSLYVNGVLVDSAISTITDWDGGDGSGLGRYGENLMGGFASVNPNTYYKGEIASFRVYSSVLTTPQAQQNFHAITIPAQDIDDTLSVSGIYNGSSLVTGTGTPITLPSGAIVTLESTTGTISFDPTGISDISKLWNGSTYVDTFTYQASDGSGNTSDATVEIVVHGISQNFNTTVSVTEGRTTNIGANELMAAHQVESLTLNPFVALYAHPDQTIEEGGIWSNSGCGGNLYDTILNSFNIIEAESNFGGITHAIENPRGEINSLGYLAHQNITMELWFKPSFQCAGRTVLFEAGGDGNGTQIYFDGNNDTVGVIVDAGDNNNTNLNMTAELQGVSRHEFNQIIALVDFDSQTGSDTLTLYLNNDPTSAFSSANTVTDTNISGDISDICGNNASGIGIQQLTAAFSTSYGAFDGQIAHIRIYDRKLSMGEIETAYRSVRKPLTSISNSTLNASLSIETEGDILCDATSLSTNIAYGTSAADTFMYEFTDSDGSTVSITTPMSITGTGSTIALDDTLIVTENASATTFYPMDNDVGAGSGVITQNIVVADYRDDYQAGLSNNQAGDLRDANGHGWQYMWNAPLGWVDLEQFDGDTGHITNTADYIHLVWDASLSNWAPNSDGVVSSGAPGEWLRLTATGGHPGSGINDITHTNSVNRYAIAAYTVAEEGYYNITESFLTKPTTAGGNGLDLVILINDDVYSTYLVPVNATINFDQDLGYLSASDTVYVAIGPYLSRGSDGFSHDFSIVKRTHQEAEIADLTGTMTSNGIYLSYDPAGNFEQLGEGQFALETYTYTVLANGELTSATVTIQINGVNDAPVATDDTRTITEDSLTISGNLLDNDIDIDNGDQYTLIVTEVQGNPGNVGVGTTSDLGALITLFEGGYYTYDHTNKYNYMSQGDQVIDTFSYRIEDQYSAQSALATVTITINGVDDPVIATENEYTLDDDETISGNVITDDTGSGVDISIDTSEPLILAALDTSKLQGVLTMGTLKPVCFRGSVTLSETAQTISYDSAGGTFANPVIFTTPEGVSEPEPGSIKITNINAANGTFDIEFKEQVETGVASDGDGASHPSTTSISWMVFESGQHILPDGTRFEVGRDTISAKHRKNATAITWDVIKFTSPFKAQPVVINQLQTWNDPDGELYGTRMNGTDYATGGVTSNQFEVALEDYELDTGTTAHTEDVGWIAIDNTNGVWNGNLFQAGVASGIKILSEITVKNFDVDFGDAPYMIASLPTVGGADPATLRSRTITGTTFELCAVEDTVGEAEVGHYDENATFLAIGGTDTTLYAYHIDISDGSFTYDPTGNIDLPVDESLIETFTYTITDGNGTYFDTKTVTITVNAAKHGTFLIIR